MQSGITTLIWAGDADWICNWFGGLASANAITYSGSSAFNSEAVTSYTVNGVAVGTFKSVGNLSWLRVFGAGHEVPYYRKSGPKEFDEGGRRSLLIGEIEPQLALQVFTQTMQKKAISST